MKLKNFLTAMSAVAFISCAPQPSFAQTNRAEMCQEVSKLALQVMMHRQFVNDLDAIFPATEDVPLAEYILIKAYRVPLVPDDEKEALAVEFANQAGAWCMTSNSVQSKRNGGV